MAANPKRNADTSVAIVGIGGIFPGAPDLEQFWQVISSGHSTAREVPSGRWPISPTDAFAHEPGAHDSVYSLRGCFIESLPPLADLDDLAVDTETIATLDPLFQLLLHAGKRAFADGITQPLDLSRVGVIVGNLALPTEKSAQLARHILGRTFEEKLLGHTLDGEPTNPLNSYVAGLPAGILAQALGLGGGSCTLDAACASSLYAIKLAVDELLAGRADAMLSGGVSRPDSLYTQMGFSQLRALSRRGICSPFDAAGDGLVVGEGAGIFLLKRTADAVAHGDHIYGVIKGIGLANDVGGSLLAPLSEGQLRAMRAAYHQAGWTPQDVDLIECHATGTPVGDATEVASLRDLWKDVPTNDGQCVIGSVKSNIGHLLTGAGAAALTKVLLALRNGTLPPTANFTAAPPETALANSPFRVLKVAAEWPRRAAETPRRAAISAFGFGGINAHLLIEEWLVPAESHEPVVPPGQRNEPTEQPPLIAVVGLDARIGPWQGLRQYQERVLGGESTTVATSPGNWWGAEQTSWFRKEGLHLTPFSGYFIHEVVVAADQFRIPPREIEEMLPQQLLMLQTAAGAMADAGLDRMGNLRTGVFIGIALDLNSTNFSFRWSIAQKATAWSRDLGLDLSPADLAAWVAELRDAAGPPLTANRTMGALGSIVASRIAREFKAGGPSFTLSNEENSGVRALETACRLLQNGEIDRALVGAVDFAGDLRAVLGHHAVQPLSAGGSPRPFDQQADGSIIGEGATAVVLKRLEDAERDGDRIYAVIKGIGTAGGTTGSPPESVFRQALARAYGEAGVEPASIGFLEAHGSGHPVQDCQEASALATFFTLPEDDGAGARTCAIASVKADIGHCGAASGLASFVRGCLALYQEIIPPSHKVERPLPQLKDATRLHLPEKPRYWLRNRSEGPRRAGINVASVDGTCSHVVLEGWENLQRMSEVERYCPIGAGSEFLFTLTGENVADLKRGIQLLRKAATTADMPGLARQWHERDDTASKKPLALVLLARTRDELHALLDHCPGVLAAGGTGEEPLLPPLLRDRIFHAAEPLGAEGGIAFVFPGSGNHYPAMGMELSTRWPGILRRQDLENAFLRQQFQPELFWNDVPLSGMNDDHRAVIFGQVATGCAASDMVRSFGIEPQAVIGYSLGESAGLFALRAWQDRDQMLARMNASTLFTHDLAGECRAAARTWGLDPDKEVEWTIGVVDVPAGRVRRALPLTPRVYLLIINTPDECVIGGDAKGIKRLVAMLDCRFFPLQGVTTVHCEIAQQVAKPYRDLHLFPVSPPQGISFYSGAWGKSYEVTRETAADAILAQAVGTIDFPEVIEAAYRDGVRHFLEMGPGSSCSRMIDRILAGRPHLARSVSSSGQDETVTMLRLAAHLIAERVPVNLEPLFAEPPVQAHHCLSQSSNIVRVATGGSPFAPPAPPHPAPGRHQHGVASQSSDRPACTGLPTVPTACASGNSASGAAHDPFLAPLINEFAASQDALRQAHEVYLRFATQIAGSVAETLSFQLSLQESLAACLPGVDFPSTVATEGSYLDSAVRAEPAPSAIFDRENCFEFARGTAAGMLGPAFAEADTFPTRVRLPDEPLMLVDRIMALEGEARSMTNGRVVTQHDVLPGSWYLDGGRIPTCIAVEAGQADLFLSGYLGIDFITRGLSVYRLLDAVVTFHRELPGPGSTINYDIHIERFFRQGDTWLFRFRFEATVDGQPLLTMRDGCAGFFSQQELEAGKGIVRPNLDLRPTSGNRPSDWQNLVPMSPETYNAAQLDLLRAGDLAGCFGPLFAGLNLVRPLTIPGSRMRLVHRVIELDPHGGRCGLGLIRAEADIRPDDWFLTCHFVDDRVMPGTLMYECCMHTLRIFLLRMGWIAEGEGAAWQPVPGVASQLRCRGQVLETTKVVTYEVSVRELGYGPEPYAIVDALMYADGKAIVEISTMSVRLTGTSRAKLETLWHGQQDCATHAPCHKETGLSKPVLYNKEQILAYSNGPPSEGFGDKYRMFDRERIIARLPGPPYQFLDRITRVAGEPWQMAAGALAEGEYDIPPNEWYFQAERQPRMPFAVLLEVALQPCGWLAAYVGSALTSPTDLAFRNLGGNAVQHRLITPGTGTVTATATLRKVATSGGMIIQEFDFSVADRQGVLYDGETMFGFFSRDALANQVGIRDAAPYRPSAEEAARGRSLLFPQLPPYPDRMLRMIDRIDLFVADGGPAGLGYLRGIKDVDPQEWFFKAHFYQDPVTPGSLGLESFLQLVKFAAVERWGWHEGEIVAAVALQHRHSWIYRGQIVPASREVTVEAWITAINEEQRMLTADGLLSVDGKPIYQMKDFTVIVESD